ncbi:lamin tail domain-containing protein [Actinoplanes awajinensis]|uniref:lamin tail domain-containing protein n=1 Tax=Actinoplanes awajinensis TaxID=135946 RepID=UPI00082CC628|nr:lamin tail domain-containing protein [Actinoplanes awajinensis]
MRSPSNAPNARKPWRWIAVASMTAATAVAGIGIASAATTTAAAPPAVRFTKIYYNSPGADTRSKASLNAEYAQITNKSARAVSLSGWTVRDASHHVFTLSGTLAAGKTLTVHTGKGVNGRPARHRYWQSGNYIWNNTGDTATLRTGNGTTVHTCTWGRTGSVTTCTPATPATSKPTPAPATSAAPVPTPSSTRPTDPSPTPPPVEESEPGTGGQ